MVGAQEMLKLTECQVSQEQFKGLSKWGLSYIGELQAVRGGSSGAVSPRGIRKGWIKA